MNPWVGKISWRRESLPTPVFWPGEFHGPYSPWNHEEPDTIERLNGSNNNKTESLGGHPDKGSMGTEAVFQRQHVMVTRFLFAVQSLSRVQLFATPGTAARQTPCPSPAPRACSNSCPLSQWCHPTISSSVVPFSSCLQSFSASRSFLWFHSATVKGV